MVSFVEALFSRYADSRTNQCSIQIFIVGSLSPGKEGKNLILPPALSLNGCQIREAGSQRKIREICQNVEELDLASNDLIDFNEVFKIVKEMPFLKFLNLSANDFSKATSAKIVPVKLRAVKSLVLNNTKVPWSIVTLLLDAMPSLAELHISLNNYTAMDIRPHLRSAKYRNIKKLYISKNPNLKSWEAVANLLKAFPSLQILSMSDCNISTITVELHKQLPRLQSLNISNWPIKSWEQLERLNNSPNLTDLRCKGLRLLENYNCSETRRQHLIARLPIVKRLNGSEISADERMHAEKAFVRYYVVHTELKKPERYYTLFDIHGRVDPVAEINLTPPKFAEVKVSYDAGTEAEDGGEKLSKLMKVDLNKSVRDFKNELSDLFGLPASQMRLFYIDHVMIEIMGPEEMKFNQKKLYTYNVQDGDEFIVDHKYESNTSSSGS